MKRFFLTYPSELVGIAVGALGAILLIALLSSVGIHPAQAQVRNTYEITSFPTRALAVTPSDVTVFDNPSTICVGGAGDVVVLPENSAATVNFTAWPAGTCVPVLVRQVYSTGTTATALVRVY